MHQQIQIVTALLETFAPPTMTSADYHHHVDQLRKQEYPSLIGTTYLDHAGTTIYSQSLINNFCNDLTSNLFGNPHSASPSSALSTQRVDRTRLQVLKYFNADPELFDVVFTANATAAIKMVADVLSDFWLAYHKDTHTSIVGMRELAQESRCFTSDEVESWIQHPQTHTNTRLFAYPAQSNMTGHRPSLNWPARIRSSYNCLTLLDAASFLTTGNLDLSNYDEAPDFIALSFYKIFGFPDLGALIVRKDAFHIFDNRKYFGGGTVEMIISIGEQWHARKTETLHDRLEDGTLPFHNIIALSHAITTHQDLFGQPQQISKHTSQLISWLFTELSNFQHHNSRPVIRVYKDKDSTFGDPKTQGPILAFSVLNSNGMIVGKSKVEALAIACGIHLRTGGVCNPGGIATMLNLEPWEMHRNYAEGMRCGDEMDIIGGKPTGIIRISLGAMTTFTDVQVFAQFVRFFFVESYPKPHRRLTSNSDVSTFSHTITPISGSAPFELPTFANKSVEETYLQYQPWHDQWLLVEPNTQTPINKRLVRESHLQTSIDALSGKLRIRANNISQNDLEIELNSVAPSNAKPFEVYQDHTTQQWLTTALGTPATLARRRPDLNHLETIASSCVISRCQIQCRDRKELEEHYEIHGADFEQLLSISGIDRGCRSAQQQPYLHQQHVKPLTPAADVQVQSKALAMPTAGQTGWSHTESQIQLEKPQLPWLQHEYSPQKPNASSPSIWSRDSVESKKSVKMVFRKILRTQLKSGS